MLLRLEERRRLWELGRIVETIRKLGLQVDDYPVDG